MRRVLTGNQHFLAWEFRAIIGQIGIGRLGDIWEWIRLRETVCGEKG